jgi:hypothetical protein
MLASSRPSAVTTDQGKPPNPTRSSKSADGSGAATDAGVKAVVNEVAFAIPGGTTCQLTTVAVGLALLAASKPITRTPFGEPKSNPS